MSEQKLIAAENSIPVKEVDADKLLQNFSQLLTNPEDRKHFIKAMTEGTNKRAIRHKGPYYKAKYALQLKQTLDNIMADKQHRTFLYKDFPQLASHNTLYLKILQSKAYLLDHFDTEGKYRMFCENELIVTKLRGEGIMLHIRGDIVDDGNFTPTVMSKILKKDSWKDKVEEYLKSDQKGFELDGLTLTEDECRNIELQLAQIPTISAHITSDRIVIVKD